MLLPHRDHSGAHTLVRVNSSAAAADTLGADREECSDSAGWGSGGGEHC